MSFQPVASPNRAGGATAASARVKDKPRGNFILAYHPADWQCDAAGNMLPTIVHFSKESGVNGVDKDGDFAPAEKRYRSMGYVLIPHDVLGEQDYVAPYLNKKGRLVCRTIFQTGYTLASGETAWAHDSDAHAQFVRLLRVQGVIRQPEPAIVQGMIESKQAAKGSIRKPSDSDPQAVQRYRDELTMYERQIANLENELVESERIYGAVKSQAANLIANLLGEAEANQGPALTLSEQLAGQAEAADPLIALDVPTAIRDALRESGIKGPGDIANMSRADLLRIPGVGATNADRITASLTLLGFSLRDS